MAETLVKMSEKISEPTKSDTVTLAGKEIMLVHWEEWALAMEEHFHATDLYTRNPNGLPMGHR